MIKTLKLRSYLKVAVVSGVLLLLAGCAQQTAEPAPAEPSPAEPVVDEQLPSVEVQSVTYNRNGELSYSPSVSVGDFKKIFEEIVKIFYLDVGLDKPEKSDIGRKLVTNVPSWLCSELEGRLPQSLNEQECVTEVTAAVEAKLADIKVRANNIRNNVTNVTTFIKDHQGDLRAFFQAVRSAVQLSPGANVDELETIIRNLLGSLQNVRDEINQIKPGILNFNLDNYNPDDGVLINLILDLLENKDVSIVFSFFDKVKEGGGCEIETQGVKVVPGVSVQAPPKQPEDLESQPEVVVNEQVVGVYTDNQGPEVNDLNTQAANAPAKTALYPGKYAMEKQAAKAQIYAINSIKKFIENGGVFGNIRGFICRNPDGSVDQQCVDGFDALRELRLDRLQSHVDTLKSVLTALDTAMENLKLAINIQQTGEVKTALITKFNEVQTALERVVKAIQDNTDPQQALANAQQKWAAFTQYVQSNVVPAVQAALDGVQTRLDGITTTVNLVGNVDIKEWVVNTCQL